MSGVKGKSGRKSGDGVFTGRKKTLKNPKMKAVFFAISAAVFYAVNMPCSKTLLNHVSSTMMAGLLYCGAGIGIGIIFILNSSETNKNNLQS